MAEQPDFLDEILAELGPEEKSQLLANVVQGLSPVNEATAPGPALTTGGAAPAFSMAGGQSNFLAPLTLAGRQANDPVRDLIQGALATGNFEQLEQMVQFDPQGKMGTANLQPDRERIAPDLTPVSSPGLLESEMPAARSFLDRQAAEISGEIDYGEMPKGVEVGIDPSKLFVDPAVVEAKDKEAQEALAPAKAQSVEPLAAQVGASGVMQPGPDSTLEQTRLRTRGVDRTNEQYERRLELSRLLELQALRQLQKAEQTRARPRSLMEAYTGSYAQRSAQDAQRRINMAREYFNRSGAIQRELVKEKDIMRKTRQAEARLTQQQDVLAERQRKAMADEQIRKDGLKFKRDKLNWDQLAYDKMTPYQKAVVAVRRSEATGRARDRANAMANRSRESWNQQVRNIQSKLDNLSTERRMLNNKRFSGRFMMPREKQLLEQQIDIIDSQVDNLTVQQNTFSQALSAQIERGTNIPTDTKERKSLFDLEGQD
jgi:hypothetical protein